MKTQCRYFKKPCIEHQCMHYVQMHGADPQTGVPISEFMCADIAMLKVALEGNKEVRQHAAATESFRNEMVTAQVRWLDKFDDDRPPLLPPARGQTIPLPLEHTPDE